MTTESPVSVKGVGGGGGGHQNVMERGVGDDDEAEGA